MPGILIGNLHVSPDLIAKKAVMSTPKPDGLPTTRQSAANAATGVKLSATAAKTENRIADLLCQPAPGE